MKAASGTASESRPSAAHAFWQILTLFDSTKLSTHRAFRNTLGVVLPLIAAFALHMPRGGLVVASGALGIFNPFQTHVVVSNDQAFPHSRPQRGRTLESQELGALIYAIGKHCVRRESDMRGHVRTRAGIFAARASYQGKC